MPYQPCLGCWRWGSEGGCSGCWQPRSAEERPWVWCHHRLQMQHQAPRFPVLQSSAAPRREPAPLHASHTATLVRAGSIRATPGDKETQVWASISFPRQTSHMALGPSSDPAALLFPVLAQRASYQTVTAVLSAYAFPTAGEATGQHPHGTRR